MPQRYENIGDFNYYLHKIHTTFEVALKFGKVRLISHLMSSSHIICIHAFAVRFHNFIFIHIQR